MKDIIFENVEFINKLKRKKKKNHETLAFPQNTEHRLIILVYVLHKSNV